MILVVFFKEVRAFKEYHFVSPLALTCLCRRGIIGISNMKNLVNKPQTMTSRDLHKIVFDATGKFKEISNFHKKCEKTLINQSDSILESAEKLPNGHIKQYHLNEVQCNMVMASIDINHLQLISEVFVKVKNNSEPQLTLTPEQTLIFQALSKTNELEAQQKAIQEKQDEHESILNRHGAPFGFMGIKKFATINKHHLSTKVYKEIAEAYHVETKPYMTQTPQGFEVATTGYNIDQLRTATSNFIEEAVQLTPAFVTHPENGIRAKYTK